ncbi:GAF domain-containing protein [Candidatus Desantisbacteria bacterium]|nr:GAF domain-containing protein [Candidatus Desantisbacteria bacterium]
MDIKSFENDFFELINIGIALSDEREMDKLLEMIVNEARKYTNSDAGSLYIIEEDSMKFVVAQNDTLDKKIGIDSRKASFKSFNLPINKKSLAGYVAVTGSPLILDDVYLIPDDSEYKFNKEFDKRNNYRSKSMLIVPLLDGNDNIIGVLQLINRLNNDSVVIPFDSNSIKNIQWLALQASVAIKNAKKNIELKKAHLNTLLRLSITGEYREDQLGEHVKRIFTITGIISRELNPDMHDEKIEMIKYSRVIHYIGKIAIPNIILLKAGKLTPEERKIIETHTTVGARILDDPSSPILMAAKEVALTHHEKYDGTGYPNRLKGEEIPLSGRIVAIADVFDALVSKRCYKQAYSMEEAINIIKNEKGKHFDPKIVDAFIDGLDIISAIWD